jgi:hypothetical protein
MLLPSRDVGVQNFCCASKAADHHPDLLHRRSRRNAALSSELALMFHFIYTSGLPSRTQTRSTVPSGKEASEEGRR